MCKNIKLKVWNNICITKNTIEFGFRWKIIAIDSNINSWIADFNHIWEYLFNAYEFVVIKYNVRVASLEVISIICNKYLIFSLFQYIYCIEL